MDKFLVLLENNKRRRLDLESDTHFEAANVKFNTVEIGPGFTIYSFMLPASRTDALHAELVAALPAEPRKSNLPWYKGPIPRKDLAYLGNDGYSNKKVECEPEAKTPAHMRQIVDDVNAVMLAHLGPRRFKPFTRTLVNWYENGTNYIPAHSDDNDHLAKPVMVATLSLGQVRTLRFRRKSDKKILKDVDTTERLVYVMAGERAQIDYTHEVVKVGGEKGLSMGMRISVTFRRDVNAPEEENN